MRRLLPLAFGIVFLLNQSPVTKFEEIAAKLAIVTNKSC